MIDFKGERLKRGWSANKAARLAGLSTKTWLRIEHGEPIRSLTLVKAAAIFQSTPIVDAAADSSSSVHAVVDALAYLTRAELECVRSAASVAIAIRSAQATEALDWEVGTARTVLDSSAAEQAPAVTR